jgi:hypothetical protein
MFAMAGLLMRGREDIRIVESAFDIADKFMETRELKAEEQQGIVAIKKKKKNVPE